MAFNTAGKNISIHQLIEKVALINDASGWDLSLDYPEESYGFVLRTKKKNVPKEVPLGTIGRSRAEANRILDAIIGGMIMMDAQVFVRAKKIRVKLAMEAATRL